MNKIYVLVGLPASGKSTYAREVLSKEAIIYSSDAIRKELFGNEACQANHKLVFSTLYTRAKQSLADGKNIVIDATSINKFERERVLSNFKDVNAYRVAIYFDTPVELCYQRDEKRSRTVGREVIDKYVERFEYPSMEEGFDEIMIINGD